MKKRSYIIHTIIIIIGIALMLLASFKDLEISQALGRPNSMLGTLFVTLGEWPAYATIPLAATILFYNRDMMKPEKYVKLFELFWAGLCFAGWAIWIFNGSRAEGLNFVDHLDYTTFSVLGITAVYASIFTIISLSIGKLVKPETMQLLCKWAVFALIVIAVSLIVSRPMKMFWGRMRYGEMLAENNNFANFTPWWEVMNNSGSSFPSGHATSSANIFIYVVLCDIFPKLRKYKIHMYVGCAIFTLTCMFSRIVNLDHFLSDVVVGGWFAYFEFVIVKKIFFKNGTFTFSKNKLLE